ncbi:hypothetical protein EYF80_003401 [Liparis tanakae]|uniref:Uncharacterized protein n=1 Tax=Liparis tanakae TaxID=230148 RepID=A0A4Z2J803_9TELE|nr:hypothetical protein EYF80_003401 [Liparis tanakae]
MKVLRSDSSRLNTVDLHLASCDLKEDPAYLDGENHLLSRTGTDADVTFEVIGDVAPSLNAALCNVIADFYDLMTQIDSYCKPVADPERQPGGGDPSVDKEDLTLLQIIQRKQAEHRRIINRTDADIKPMQALTLLKYRKRLLIDGEHRKHEEVLLVL